MFTHALTVCSQGMILTDSPTLLDLCVSSTAHTLSQSSLVRNTPPPLWTGSTRTTGRSSFSGATRTRPGGNARTPLGGATRVSPSNATLLYAKFFGTTLSTPAWISFWRCHPHAPLRCHPHAPLRCHPHAPPFPCSSGSAFRPCPDCATHASQRCLAGKCYSPFDRADRASSPWAHPRRHWPNVSEVHVSIASLASDGGSQFGIVRRPISVDAASFIAGRRSHDGVLPRTCCRGASRQHL